MSDIAARLSHVREQISDALCRTGRPERAVTLVAVSKLMPSSSVTEAIRAGHTCFGENYVQEALEKFTRIEAELKVTGMLSAETKLSLHLIGPLQRNKVRRAVGWFNVLETVGCEKTLHLVSDEAIKKSIVQQVFIQVNISGEESKSGCPPSEVEKLIRAARSLKGVSVNGLMSIGTPPTESQTLIDRREFVDLRNLRDELEKRCSISLPELSMGMSNDFVEAIEEGATVVRVGSAIFGERPGA